MANQKPYDEGAISKLLIALQRNLQLIWKLFRHPQVPFWVKGILVLTALYWFNPVDPLPPPLNFFPFDDMLAILLGTKLFVELAPADLVNTLRRKIEFGDSADDEVIDSVYRILDDE